LIAKSGGGERDPRGKSEIVGRIKIPHPARPQIKLVALGRRPLAHVAPTPTPALPLPLKLSPIPRPHRSIHPSFDRPHLRRLHPGRR
jgi:hypothetical protein